MLVEFGYEPRTDSSGLVLANCPFHGLADEYTDLVCGMNLELLSGLLDGRTVLRCGIEKEER